MDFNSINFQEEMKKCLYHFKKNLINFNGHFISNTIVINNNDNDIALYIGNYIYIKMKKNYLL